MRLIRLALKNFRQHADTELEFRSGLTGIIGPNGAGKTTILEAIAWTIYGAPAMRGTKDTLRFHRAPGRSAVRAELEFELRGDRFRAARTPRGAELYHGDQPDPIASGIGEVTRQLTRRLGMTRDEFFNTYFTKQKDLQFLATMGPAERGRFLSQVLGYERLRTAQGLVREERKVLKGQVEELRGGLGDPEAIQQAKEAAEAELREASAAMAEAEKAQAAAAARFAEQEPLWNELQKAREAERELTKDLELGRAGLERAARDQREAEEELSKLAEAAAQLQRLKEEIGPLEGLPAEEERLASLAEAAAQRKSRQAQLDEQRQRVESLSERLRAERQKAAGLDDLKARAQEQEKSCQALESQLQEDLSAWQREAQDVEARLRFLRDQAADLKEQIAQLESEGPDGSCPTCKRPLGMEYDSVLALVRGQYEEVVQDGKWHSKRLEQLRAEPDAVAEARKGLEAARRQLDGVRKELGLAEAAVAQADSLKAELDGEEARARSLAGEIAKLPEGYDEERHAEVRQGLKRLQELQTGVTQLETRLEREPELKGQLAEAREEQAQIRDRIAEIDKGRKELGFSQERYDAVREAFDSARGQLEAARLEFKGAEGAVETARQRAETAREAEREQQKLSRRIAQRESQFRLHNELDRALGELRDELNDRVRPELSEIASVFLTELTDGRYNRIEIDKDYEVVVLDDGEEKPVISGGEEDVANLVLRLAISQMIAERAGQTLSLLIFDEVFGGLDEQRRESVVRLLQRLQAHFEQIVLITHIESIREGMDQVVRVSYDERSGASIVRDESPGAGGEVPEVEDLATLVAE